MDWSGKFWLTALLLLAGGIAAARGNTVVSGTVFCDQCRDGELSIFDYPVQGIKVQIVCRSGNGEPQSQVLREETTNWFGGYSIRFDGEPDLNDCYAQVAGGGEGGGSQGCSAASGSPKSLRLMFSIFGLEMYSVDPLLSQPAQPESFCPRSPSPIPVTAAPPPPSLPPRISFPPIQNFPHFPPFPQFPPFPGTPPLPRLQASACSYRRWIMPEHRCYWKVVTPYTKVAVVFGPAAVGKYGTEMTLVQAMLGRGDPYRTLLREGTTALLNAYDSAAFTYQPLSVVLEMNTALMGSKRQVLHTALRFLRANAGVTTHATCRFTACH